MLFITLLSNKLLPYHIAATLNDMIFCKPDSCGKLDKVLKSQYLNHASIIMQSSCTKYTPWKNSLAVSSGEDNSIIKHYRNPGVQIYRIFSGRGTNYILLVMKSCLSRRLLHMGFKG